MDYNQEQFLRMQQYQNAPKMPFYMNYPVQNIYLTEMEYDRDMERMKDLYPEEAKRIQGFVEEECDKMEYEGSMMFDEYPDRLMLKVICDRIYENVLAGDAQAGEAAGQEAEELQVSQQNFWPGPGRPPGPPGWPPPGPGRPPGPPGWPPPGPGRPPGHGRPPHNQGLGNLIEVLLYNEMYKRRCRHNRCRRWW